MGNALEAYVVEVTGKKFGVPFPLLDINKPESCQAAKASGCNATITEHSVYNKGGAAFVMLEYGTAGLRVFDLRDGNNPNEAACCNDSSGHAYSGVFSYDETRGIMVASGGARDERRLRRGHQLFPGCRPGPRTRVSLARRAARDVPKRMRE